jgi:TonB dependent receptor
VIFTLSARPAGEDYNALVNRYDANISDKHRLFVSWYRSRRHSTASDWNTPKPGLEVSGIIRHPKGIGGDYIWTVNSTTALDLGLHWTSYATGNERPVQTSYKPSDFGLPTYLNDKAGDATQVPTLTFSSLNSLSDTYPTINSRGNTGQLKSAFTYVKAADNTTTASNQGLEFASFLMGLPSAVSIDTNDSGIFSTRYRSFYLQDDWRITSRLHLSPGLRYEREGGITERFNRGLAGGFLAGATFRLHWFRRPLQPPNLRVTLSLDLLPYQSHQLRPSGHRSYQ